MIYLIAQISLALCLAGLLGGALGWLIHRATHVRHTDQLRHALGRQQAQMSQMQSEASLLSDDYDELQRRAQDEIEALRQEAQQIPFLKTNLEKSQLLVRQMLQKHEAKVRDLNNENQKLSAKLKTIDDREQAHNQVQAELDSRQRRVKDSSSSRSADQPESAGADGLKFSSASSVSDDSASFSETTPVDTLPESTPGRPARSSWASIPLEELEEGLASATSSDKLPKPGESTLAGDAVDDPFDDVMEVGDELQRELDIEPDNVTDGEAKNDAKNDTFNDTNIGPDNDPVLDGSTDRSNLFEPVEQRDDLKQIFGIGPVTEKALNQLGITSYSQLAELKHHEIETIAEALHIVPGRIERDDWVGNARRQLEDVLEEL